MNDFKAIGLCEGFIECNDKNKIIKAWQHLIDTGRVWTLQGWFGRTASDLIQQGICKKPKQQNKEGD